MEENTINLNNLANNSLSQNSAGPNLYNSPVNQTVPGSTVTSTNIPATNIPATNIPATNIPADIVQAQSTENIAPTENTAASTTGVSNVNEAINQARDTEEKKPEIIYHKVVEDNKYYIRTVFLRDIMSNINKAISFDNRNNLSTVTQLKFTNDGLEVIASDNDIIIVQKNIYDRYDKEISFGVSSEKFKNLLDKITDDEFALAIDVNNHCATLHTINGEFKLPERSEGSTGEAVNIELPEQLLNTAKIAIPDIIDIQDKVKAILPFAATTDAYPYCQGVYFDSNTINTTEGNNFGVVRNFNSFQGNIIFLPTQFAKAFTELKFDPSSAQFGFITEDGFVKPNKIIFQADNLILMGNARPQKDYNDFPIAGIKDFDSVIYNNKIIINREAVLSLLERMALFVDDKPDKGAVELIFGLNNILIKSLEGFGEERIYAENANSQINPIKLDFKALTASIKNLKAQNIEFEVDNNQPNMVAMYIEGMRITIAQYGGE